MAVREKWVIEQSHGVLLCTFPLFHVKNISNMKVLSSSSALITNLAYKLA